MCFLLLIPRTHAGRCYELLKNIDCRKLLPKDVFKWFSSNSSYLHVPLKKTLVKLTHLSRSQWISLRTLLNKISSILQQLAETPETIPNVELKLLQDSRKLDISKINTLVFLVYIGLCILSINNTLSPLSTPKHVDHHHYTNYNFMVSYTALKCSSFKLLKWWAISFLYSGEKRKEKKKSIARLSFTCPVSVQVTSFLWEKWGQIKVYSLPDM